MLRAILRAWGGPDASRTRLRSELEARMLILIDAAELPAPLCNQRIEIDGEHLEVDFLWPEKRLVVETDGWGFHDNPVAFERDRKRDRALQLASYRVIRFTYAQLEGEADTVVAAIRRLLGEEFR